MAEAPFSVERCDPFEEKLIRVTAWLKKIFGIVPVPWYEVNERTVDILHEVMEYNEEREKDVRLLIEDMKDWTTKYEAEANYWRVFLRERLGLDGGSLSDEATEDVIDLVQSALELGVENTSLTSFYGAINLMTSELYEKELKNQELELKVKTLTKKLTSALTLEKQLEKDVNKLEKSQEGEMAKAEIQSQKLRFLEVKSKDLRISIRDAENKLIAMGMDQSLTHEALVSSSQELAALQKKIEPLKKELAAYYDLPPSIPLARVKVEEERKKLKALDEELTREINALGLELT